MDDSCWPDAKFHRIFRVACFPRAGSLASPEVAIQIATGAICPKTREPWREPVAVTLEGLPPRLSLSRGGARGGKRAGRVGNRVSFGGTRGGAHGRGRGGNARQGRKRVAPFGGAEGDTYSPAKGFGPLPGADMDFLSWHVDQLREFLSVSKPLCTTNR